MVKSAKSNTKVIKIAPEVDVQASNKTKQDIKKLTQQLEFTLTGVGKGLSEHGIGGLNRISNDTVKNIIKDFKSLHPSLQKEIKSGYGEISKFFNSIQKEFIKSNEGVEKQFVKSLKSMLKETKSAAKELDKEAVRIRQSKQKLYESLFPQADRAYNLNILRQRKIIRPRVLENIEASRLARESSGFSQFEAKASGVKFKDETTVKAYNDRFQALYAKMAKKGDKYLQDFSRRMTIYFSYKTIDLFTKSVTGAVDSLVKLQSAFANIQAITASTTGQMEKIRKAVFDVGVNTRFATEEVADAAVVLGQAGLSTQEIASVLEHTATLASATGEDLKSTAGLMTSVLSIWNMNADQASHVADVFVTSANDTKATLDSLSYGIQYAGTSLAQLGVSFEEASAVMSASTNAGLKSSSMLGTGMRALATELTNQSKRMQETLASLGLTFDDVDIQSLGLIKVLKNLKEAGFGATEAFAAFDRRAATYALAALSELDTAEKLTEEFNRSGAAAKANATQMATLESQLISLQDIIAKGLSTSFRVLTDLLSGLLSGINGFLKAADGLAVRLISSATSIGVFGAALLKLRNIYKSLQVYRISLFTEDAIKILRKEKGELTYLTSAMIRQKAAALSLAAAWKFLGASLGIGALLTLLSYGLEKLFYGSKNLEDEIAELNETMETHRSTMNSVASDLDELRNKEGLYTDDVDALNKRIAELNRKYADNGFVVEYANANEDLSEKLKLVREELEAIDRIENKRRANAGYDVAKKKLESAEDIILGGSDYGFFKNSAERILYKRRRSIKSQIDEILNSDSSDRFVNARNLVLNETAGISNIINDHLKSGKINESRANEERAYLASFEKALNDYITSRFRFMEAEIDKKSAEFDASAEGLEVEQGFNDLAQEEAQFVSEQLNSIVDAVNHGNLETVNSSDVSNGIKTVFEHLEGVFLSKLRQIESQIPEELRSSTKYGAEIESTINKINRGTYVPKEINDLLKNLEAWTGNNQSKEKRALADNIIKQIKDYLRSIVKYPDGISDKQILRNALEADRLSAQNDKLNDRDKDPRSNAFLDRLRNDLSNISESTKSSKKARDLALRGYQYNGSMTSAQSGLYKTYSDEMNLLETARNTERYAKVLEELKEKYGYVLTKKEELNRVEVTALDLMKDTENKLNESKDAYEVITGSTYKYGASLTDLNQKILELQGKLDETTEQNLNPFQQVLQGITNKYQELMNKQRQEGSVFTQLGETIYNSGLTNMENALISICDRTKSVSDAFRDMLADILKEIRNFLIRQAVQQFFMMIGSSIASGGFLDPGITEAGGSVSSGSTIRRAAGGVVTGGIKGRDSVHTKLMPGEYVIKKSAVDVLGTKFLNNLNTNTTQTMNTVGAMMGGTSLEGQSEPAVVNVWVVSERDEAQMGPNDVIATISKDLQQGGTTKKLIQTIVAGRKA